MKIKNLFISAAVALTALTACQSSGSGDAEMDKFIDDLEWYVFPSGNNDLAIFIHPKIDILHIFAGQFIFNFNAFILDIMNGHGNPSFLP